MSSLAYILRKRGNWVGGSDRNYDRNLNRSFFSKLKKTGISLCSQNGNAITDEVDVLVVSSAIEEQNPELQKARSLHIPVVHRAELLAKLFNSSYGIGIAGTSGKSTVAGMVASILDAAGKDPTVINGGIVKHYESSSCLGNAKHGTSDFMVAELDESDGSITHFKPAIGVITNISKDHKELHELKDLFQKFASQTSNCLVLNTDCRESQSIKAAGKVLTFGLNGKQDITADGVQNCKTGSRFQALGTSFEVTMPGRHSLYNALASIAVGVALDIPLPFIQNGLASFQGIKRRLDLVGEKNDVIVVDDFAHNPDKIHASIRALKQLGKRLIVIFQPHGYGPTRFLLEELGSAFSSSLRSKDYLMCLDIYDAGGTADRNISSRDLLNKIQGPHLYYAKDRYEAAGLIPSIVQPGDVVVVMGARDDTLSTFAGKILREIQ